MDSFRAGAWCREIPGDGLKGCYVAVCFLTRLAFNHLFRCFPRLDNARNTFDKPGLGPASRPCPDTELLNQDNFVSDWIEWQDSSHFTALHHFPRESLRPTAIVLLMANQIAGDLEVAIADPLFVFDLDLAWQNHDFSFF